MNSLESEKKIQNTGEAADSYQRVTLTGQYLLAAMAIRRQLVKFGRPIHRLVDYGCGGGKSLWPSIPFLEPSGTAIGVDVSQDQLVFARQNAESISRSRPDLSFEFHAVDAASRMPQIADGSVQVVHSSIVLQEIRDTETLGKIFHEIARILEPGGLFVAACVSDKITDEDFVSFTYKGFEQNLDPHSPIRACKSLESDIVWEHDRHWRRAELADLLSVAGLGEVSFSDVLADPALPPFPAQPWKAWQDEIRKPPILLVRSMKASLSG